MARIRPQAGTKIRDQIMIRIRAQSVAKIRAQLRPEVQDKSLARARLNLGQDHGPVYDVAMGFINDLNLASAHGFHSLVRKTVN